MKAELVSHCDVRPGAPIYLANPIEVPSALPLYAGTDAIPQDAEVWTCFESWARYNPWLKREVNGPLGTLSSPLGTLTVGPDNHLR